MTVIGLTGKAGCGKTTAAKVLVEKGFQRLSFATPVKHVAKRFGWDGEKDEKGRRLLQLIGTEIGRWYDPDIWVKEMARKILDVEDTNKYYMDQTMIVIDDVRFNNEAKLIKDLDGFVIELTGRFVYRDGVLSSHSSERGISKELIDYSWEFPDFNSPDLFKQAFNKKITESIG